MNISLHNTLTGQKESFTPLEKGKVKLYCCGPTVYDFAHIGNFRSFVMADLLTRVLDYAGLEVTKVQNITDVGHLVADSEDGEDKILKKARLEKKDPYAIARFFEDAFLEDETKLRILPTEHRPRATDFIQAQIDMASQLITAGHAYESNGSVYFAVETFSSYGKLSKNKLEDLVAGARVEINSEKKSPLDFALWKKADANHLMQWDSPWGRGFPGWHIECSAMSRAILGDQFDIHTGGEDNIFPHHECEIAQNEGSNGGKQSVNYWLHAKHLLVDNKKMSKSDGNFYTVRDLFEKGWKGEEIRYALMSAHYRTSLNFSFSLLEMARSSIARIREAVRIFGDVANQPSFAKASEGRQSDELTSEDVEAFQTQFQTALADDLNVSDALAATFELIKWGMKKREDDDLTSEEAAGLHEFLTQDFDRIFDVVREDSNFDDGEVAEIEQLIAQRNQAREDKDWAAADAIRDQLLERGIELVDEKGKTGWRTVSS